MDGGRVGGRLAQLRGDAAAQRAPAAAAGEIDPIFGREREIRQIIDILARRRKNNPIIVGEPASARRALVEGLALMIVNGDVPPLLQGSTSSASTSAAAGRREREGRVREPPEAGHREVKGSPKPIILFIDEAHTIIGAGGQQGGGDAANLLKPALARGELRTIAATTWKEYKKYFEKDAALERRFQPVKVDEPSVEVAIVMLRGLRRKSTRTPTSVIDPRRGRRRRRPPVGPLHRRPPAPRQGVDLLDTAAATVKIRADRRRRRPPTRRCGRSSGRRRR
jgi:type VI secretion system protein VasG